MMDKTDRQFQAARAAVERAVAACMSKIEQTDGRWEAVARDYIVQRALLALCDGMIRLADDPKLMIFPPGPATLRLSNALADYRDSQMTER